MSTATPNRISPAQLADAALAGSAPPLLDVRADPDGTIDGPGIEVRQLDPDAALAQAGGLAVELPAGTVVVCARGKTAARVAAAVNAEGGDAAVLDGGMRGWLDLLRAVEVANDVPGLELLQVQRPGRGCLSYVLVAGGEALVVDPAPDAGFYADLAAARGARVTAVVDTHLHADHISGARELAAATGASLRMPRASLDRGVELAAQVDPIADGDRLSLGGVELRVLALPGHTTDMTGLVAGERLLIGGDSLFAEGIARPDLERGDAEGAAAMARLLHATLHRRVLALGDDAVLLPGHDSPLLRAGAVAPTLAEVRARVPELGLADPDEFARAILAGMPPRPANYVEIIDVNAGRRPADPDLESGGNSCATR